MGNAAYDRGHRAERANWATLMETGYPVKCWRCKKPITAGQPWDLGHLEDLVSGGNPKRRLPEHATCNRSAGGALAYQPRPSRPW